MCHMTSPHILVLNVQHALHVWSHKASKSALAQDCSVAHDLQGLCLFVFYMLCETALQVGQSDFELTM